MKKIIKIFALILFIIFVFGITPSRAETYSYGSANSSLKNWNASTFTVTKDTTPAEMLSALQSGQNLTSISNIVRDQSTYLFCRERNWYLSSGGRYELAGAPTTFDTQTAYDITNEYAKAYILAAPGYIKTDTSYGDINSKDERQYAWYCINNESYGGSNDLYTISVAYQNYKLNEEKDVTVTVDNEAKTSIVGNNVIYGPIKVEYSYKKAQGSEKSDEWGGFNYAFFDGSDTNISDKVQLCTLTDGTYTPITSTQIISEDDTNGYYKVGEATYNNVNLYVVTNDKTISSVSIKIQENKVDYSATIYPIRGEYYRESDQPHYCASCQTALDKAVTSRADAIKEEGTILDSDGKYYVYDGYKIETVYWKSGNSYPRNVYRIGGTDINIYTTTTIGTLSYPRYTSSYYCSSCDNYSTSYTTLTSSHYKSGHTCRVHSTKQYQCTICHSNTCGSRNTSSAHQGSSCVYSSYTSVRNHIKNSHLTTARKYSRIVYEFSEWTACGKDMGEKVSDCGTPLSSGYYHSQGLHIIEKATETKSNALKLDLEIQLSTSIEITKTWKDYDNAYNLRPETLKFNIFRSTDQATWEKLTENTDYKLTIDNKEGNTWKICITDIERRDNSGNAYYFKVEEQELVCYQASYPNGKEAEYNESTSTWHINIDNSFKEIDLTGYVWLDGQTGIKPAVPNNGIMDASETKLENIAVYLYYKNPETGEISKIAETKTDANGCYKFEEYEIGYYYVKFEYDGIHYEDTISVENGSSKAFEPDGDRNAYNARFQTITFGKSNDGTTLSYNYSNNKSTLVTAGENGTVKQEFAMNASTQLELYTANIENLNLGLVKRGTDIALSTDVSNAEVNINGQKTTYTYNSAENTIEIGNGQTSENVSYNLNLYASDYYYRIRNYVSNDTFKENDYINEEDPTGVTTGEELKVYVTYELNLQNQSTETTRVNEVKYTFDEKYTFKQIVDNSYTTSVSGNTITINLNSLSLGEGETKTIHLLFEVNNNNGLTIGNFSNKAEITSYSTDKGLIDVDSQPGNFVNSNQVEDDNDTAGGLTIKTEDTFARKITGKVFDEENQNVNDVIVQLIELKTVNGKVYEYIWQETVSGTGKGLRLNGAGTALEEYTYTKTDGTYEFIGFIPGDYIVRFIYGDGTTYDMTGNIIKYNGQDYKSTNDSNYKSEWYNSATYTQGASVARDNEARRLETMAYAIQIDAEKGVLLKLLNNVTVEDLNETEKELIVTVYNKFYDPDITAVTTEVINKLLKEQVLKNTWMCAETSKIKVAVDTENITNTNAVTTVNGTTASYVNNITNINLGLELRPVTKIELEKYITGFKLVAANGQTLVNAYIDVNEYLNDPTNISNKVQGIRDNVTILDTVWQYEVAPTDINTIVDGASLEFEYTLVVKNTGDTDYLSAELADAYNNSTTTDYITTLTSKANEIKGFMRTGTYRTQIGKNVGNNYYVGGTGSSKVLTEITNIRDYINNDLKFISSGGDVAIDENAPHTYRILRDDYSMQEATINTILKTTKTTGKMENNGTAVIYKITLGKNPISSTGNLNFENYIAEVMSYTNAAGRRAMTSTPGNAEIIDHEHREGKTHEIDEADTARIQVGAATGEDGTTNYIIITVVIAGVMVIVAGAVLVKKYVIK